MIAASIIGLLASLCVPLFSRFRIGGNEAAAQSALGTFAQAFESYRIQYGTFPSSLSNLGSTSGGPSFVDQLLASGLRQGYVYVLSNNTQNAYTLTATPQTFGVTGTRTFLIDQSGVLQTATNVTPGILIPPINADRRSRRWFVDGNTLYTNWSREWLEFKVEVPGTGPVEVEVAAKNHLNFPDWTLPPNYTHFELAVIIDGRDKGRLKIPASDKEYKAGKLKIDKISGSGKHTVRLLWVNDSYKKGRKWDANIQISNILIHAS